jgi:hypothetical protein
MAEGMGILAVQTYKKSTFVIHSYDKYGNHLDKGGDPWEVSIIGAEVPDTKIEDNQDGTYTVSYQTQSKCNLQVPAQPLPLGFVCLSICTDGLPYGCWFVCRCSLAYADGSCQSAPTRSSRMSRYVRVLLYVNRCRRLA